MNWPAPEVIHELVGRLNRLGSDSALVRSQAAADVDSLMRQHGMTRQQLIGYAAAPSQVGLTRYPNGRVRSMN